MELSPESDLELFVGGVLSRESLRRLADQFGTPVVVYELAAVRRNAQEVKEAFAAAMPCPVRAQFAVKSCYMPQVLREIRASGWGVEVMSGFELDRVLAAGVGGSDVTLTGLGWSDRVCDAAVRAGVRRFVVDSEADLRRLSAAGKRASRQLEVLVRVNLADAVDGTFLTANGKLGHTRDQLDGFVDRLAEVPGVRCVGVHVHQVNRLTDIRVFDKVCAAAAEVVRWLRTRGVPVADLDLGGGLETLSALAERGLSPRDFAKVAAEHVRGVRGIEEVVVECGRAISGDAAIAVGKVMATKDGGDHVVVVVDVPTNTLIPIPGATYPPTALATNQRSPARLCSFSDGTGSPVWLARDVLMPPPQVGDLVAFTQAGAYTTVFSELWAAELPTLVVVDRLGRMSVRPSADTTDRTWEAWYGPDGWSGQL